MSNLTPDLKAKAQQLRWQNRVTVETRRQRRLGLIEKHEQLRQRLMESMSFDWVGAYADILDQFRTRDPLNPGVSTKWQRDKGRNYPFYQTEQQLNILRAPSRILCGANGYAIGLVEGLTSYVIGSGYTYRIAPEKAYAEDCPKELVDAVQQVVDKTLERNQWHGGEEPGMEEELFGRSLEDGEFVLVHTPRKDGWTDFRTAEPEQLTQPPADVLEDDQDGLFGVVTPKDDVQCKLGYWLYWGDSSADGEMYQPEQITHLRRNVKRSMKRGLPDFCFDTYDALDLASKLRTNLSDAAAQQAAIVGIRQHDVNTQVEIQAFVDNQAEWEEPDLYGNQVPTRRFKRGEWEDVPKGLNYVPGPGAQNAPQHIQVLQACLRGAGVRWNAPEWLCSGDASNNNYASSLTAESPFVRTVLRRQTAYKHAFKAAIWYAVEHYCRTNGIRAAGRTYDWGTVSKLVCLLVEAPSPETRNKLEESQRAQIEIPLGVDSRQAYVQRQGRDWDQVLQDNIQYTQEAGPSLSLPDFGQEGDGGEGGGNGPKPVPKDPNAPPRLESDLREIEDDKGHQHGGDGKFTSKGGGGTGAAKHAGTDADPIPLQPFHEEPGTASAKVVDRLKGVGSKALNTRVGQIVMAAEHKLSIVAHKTRDIAEQALKERGYPPEKAASFKTHLAIADFIGGFATSGAVAATGNLLAAKGVGFLPSASALYVAYSTVTHPAATWAAARKVVAQTMSKHHEVTESLHDGSQFAEEFARLYDGVDVAVGEWRVALFLNALAQGADSTAALKIAIEGGDPQEAEPTDADFGGEG